METDNMEFYKIAIAVNTSVVIYIMTKDSEKRTEKM